MTVLHRPDGTTWVEDESYRIVTFTNNKPKFSLSGIPSGEYDMVTFTIGVDSLRNTSGAQTGALSPSENMFWSWTTGYIFIKAEGSSPESPNGMFIYHIGGFEGPNNAIRTTTIDFEGAVEIRHNQTPVISLKVNTARFWHGGLSLNDYYGIHTPGPQAATLSDNFIGAFTFGEKSIIIE